MTGWRIRSSAGGGCWWQSFLHAVTSLTARASSLAAFQTAQASSVVGRFLIGACAKTDGARQRRQHRRLAGAVGVDDRLHFHAIGGDQPRVADVAAQQSVDDARRERGGVARLERRELHMRDHDGGDAGLAGRAERDEIGLPQIVQRAVDDRQADVRIDWRVGFAGEVFSGRRDPGLLEAAHLGHAQPRDARRIDAQRAHPDRRVVDVVGEVQRGRQIPVDARARIRHPGPPLPPRPDLPESAAPSAIAPGFR